MVSVRTIIIFFLVCIIALSQITGSEAKGSFKFHFKIPKIGGKGKGKGGGDDSHTPLLPPGSGKSDGPPNGNSKGDDPGKKGGKSDKNDKEKGDDKNGSSGGSSGGGSSGGDSTGYHYPYYCRYGCGSPYYGVPPSHRPINDDTFKHKPIKTVPPRIPSTMTPGCGLEKTPNCP